MRNERVKNLACIQHVHTALSRGTLTSKGSPKESTVMAKTSYSVKGQMESNRTPHANIKYGQLYENVAVILKCLLSQQKP